MVGGVRALKHDWSTMELMCRRCSAGQVADCPRVSCGTEECCIARVPARVLRPTSKAERPQPRARPLILIVERDDVTATSHESIVLDAGFSVGASWSNYASAGKWLSAHSPDAAILDVKLQDQSCVELAKKLSEREIPFLAVSGYSPARRVLIGFSALSLGWKSPSQPPGCIWRCAAFYRAEAGLTLYGAVRMKISQPSQHGR